LIIAAERIPQTSGKGRTMNLEITDPEREFLKELFEEKQKHMIQELNHTDTIDFERMLRNNLEMLEDLMRKLDELTPRSL
jgi:hypothetical protein